MELIDIRNQLCLEDYYRTDTHWKQEYIVNAAPLIFIENPKADTDKELKIGRASCRERV